MYSLKRFNGIQVVVRTKKLMKTVTGLRGDRCMSQGYFSRVLPVLQPDDLPEKPCTEAIAAYQEIVAKYDMLLKQSIEGGGPRGIERHVNKNKKVLIRDRIKMLIDPGTDFVEIGGLAGFDMMYGDIPSAATVCGIGLVCGIYCMISGNDATVKGGTYYPITVVKSYRIQEIAGSNRLPCIYLPDSGGAFLPMQSEIFPDRKHGGRSFYNQAIMSSQGVHQIAVVCGSCTAGGAYNPTMSDEAIIVDRIGKIFLAGPPLVKAALGEVVSDEDLGGAFMHSSVSGCTDYFARDEMEAFEMCRDVVESLNMVKIESSPSYQEPRQSLTSWNGFGARVHLDKTEIYTILSAILDGSQFKEFKAFFGPGLIVGTGYIEGIMVGIVANTDKILSGEALKASHFMNLCDRRSIPLVFLQNSLPSSNCRDDIIDSVVLKDRGKMSATVATVNVPKIAITLSACYEDDYVLMCGPSFSPNFHFMWPSSKLSALSMNLPEVTGEAGESLDAFYAAFNVLTDCIILPQSTRHILAESLRILSQQKLNPAQLNVQAPVYRM